jgi:hypothetical protein
MYAWQGSPFTRILDDFIPILLISAHLKARDIAHGRESAVSRSE